MLIEGYKRSASQSRESQAHIIGILQDKRNPITHTVREVSTKMETIPSLQGLTLVSSILLLAKCGSAQYNPWIPYQHDNRVIFPHGNSLSNVSLCEEWITPIPGMDAAMEGYDPFRADPMSYHDPGVRQKIFQPLRFLPNGRVALQQFIGRSRKLERCNKHFITTTVKNYGEYKQQTRSSKRVAHNFDSKVEATIKKLTIEASAGYGQENTEEEQDIISFFKETSGEIIMSTNECLSHSVAINPFQEPVFTEGFKSALKELAVAANNPNSRESNATVKEFMSIFGTHYLEETQLGAKIYFMRGFNSRSTSSRHERERKKCAKRSAYTSLGFGVKDLVAAEIKYSHESEKCDESAQVTGASDSSTSLFVRVRSVGTFPSNTSEMSPAPISFTTKKIPSILKTKWLEANSIHGVNATQLAHFLEEKIDSYCWIMFGEECISACANSSQVCPSRHICQDDPSTALGYTCVPRYGAVIISGGSDGHLRLGSVETMESSQLPDLPFTMWGHTLTAMGDLLYNCGGNAGDAVAHCFKLDTTLQTPSWSRILDLPTAMYFHSAVSVGKHIWFVHQNKLYDLDTTMDAFEIYDLPFTVTRNHCAVSNGTHSYVIAVGNDRTEIWVASSADKWQQVGSLGRGRRNHACLWFGSQVYITGGSTDGANVELFNTRTHEIRVTGFPKLTRQNHGMFVLGGSPAIAGGWVGDTVPRTDSIETYDITTRTWKVSAHKLRQGNSHFAVAQLLDTDSN